MIKRFALLLIKAYRYALSPFFGQHCRFYPTCSSYAYEAVDRYGLMRGLWLAARRLLRCHPWHEGGYDPVPAPHTGHSHDPDTKKTNNNCT